MKYSEETSPSSTLSTNLTWNRLGLTSGLQAERSVSDSLSHGMKSSGSVYCHGQNKLMKICINKHDSKLFPQVCKFEHFNSDF